MNKKAFLLFLLLTPLIVIVSSTLAFRFGFGPEATKNNGIFFNEFTDITGMEISSIKNFKLERKLRKVKRKLSGGLKYETTFFIHIKW